MVTEVIGSNPVWAWIFFRPYFNYDFNSVHNCEDCFYVYDFYIFTVIIHHLEGLFAFNIVTSSQLTC